MMAEALSPGNGTPPPGPELLTPWAEFAVLALAVVMSDADGKMRRLPSARAAAAAKREQNTWGYSVSEAVTKEPEAVCRHGRCGCE